MIKAKEDINMSTVFAQNPTDLERFAPAEVIAAAPDFLAQAFGNKLPGRPAHPLASSIDLPTICHAFGTTNAKPGSMAASGVSRTASIVAQGASTGGFTKALRDAAAPVVLRAYQAAADQFAFAAVLKLPDFRQQPIYGLDVGHALDRSNELERIRRRPAFSESTAYGIASVASYAQIFEIGRDFLLANDVASLLNLLRGAGALAAQQEAALLVAAIDGAPVLSDGAVFDVTNTLAQALNAENLGAAVALLRNQGAPGRPLNTAPRHLAVEPGLELLARKLVRDADLSNTMQVHALPGLSTGRWVVLADPLHMPSLTLYHLEATGGALNFEVQRSFKNDGVDMSAIVDTGAGFVGRIGIVKGGA